MNALMRIDRYLSALLFFQLKLFFFLMGPSVSFRIRLSVTTGVQASAELAVRSDEHFPASEGFDSDAGPILFDTAIDVGAIMFNVVQK